MDFLRLTDLTPGDWVAFWGAVTGTVALIWRICDTVLERRAKRRERQQLSLRIEVNGPPAPYLGGGDTGDPICYVCVANTGRDSAILASIAVCSTKDRRNLLQEPYHHSELPQSIEPGKTGRIRLPCAFLKYEDSSVVVNDSDQRQYSVPPKELENARHRLHQFEASLAARGRVA